MPNSTLFPLELQPIAPAPDRREPVLWLKRLVILSSLNSSAIVREIEFRRGLNIIQTRQMDEHGNRVAGHSVGKTLLMRLMRYTLGEAHFGSEDLQSRVQVVLPEGYVVAHWVVSGKDWIVVRSLRSADGSDSFAAQSDNWRAVVDIPLREHSHRDFVKQVSDAALSGLPEFTLPRGRKANWLDVLAWLARDYQCGYRKANDWRHEDANAGPSLNLPENSLIMQWLCGLMSAEEIDLRLKHRQLLDEQAKKKQSVEQDQRKLETLRPTLWEKLELKEETEVSGEQPKFDSIKPADHVEQKIASLERLKEERAGESRVADQEVERDAAYDRVNNAESEIRACRTLMDFIEKQIQQYEQDPLRAYAKCEADPCWIREKARESADPSASDHLDDLRGQLDQQQQILATTQQAKKAHQNSLNDALKQLKTEQDRLAAERSGIDEEIGKWRAYLKDAQDFQTLATSFSRSTRKADDVKGDVEESANRQDSVRSLIKSDVQRHSDIYHQILQKIFGDQAAGRICVDGNGLRPVPDEHLAPEGAALSVMTTVLAFDVSSVAASITGLGNHPRLLLHDSPREGDMEGPLFSRLFEVVHGLESLFDSEDDISFQYIVTTTTPPPPKFADESGPYVRLTLDARKDAERLLGRAF
ncbi:hypothetical protein [Planctomicrobium sp. SH664]|uniref:hypothetical protein n=1 Tax=Planctomicrobium sp. SH664 TaxID=3448125 RepID=UPI003F5C8F9D